jgi:acid phosphatase (class A)
MKNCRPPFQRPLVSVLLSVALAVTPLRALAELNYLPPGQPDTAALLPPPPVMESAEQTADMDEVRTVYHAAGSNDIAAAYSEKQFTVFNFTDAVGGFFAETNLPKTGAFFEKVQKDAEAVTDHAKEYFRRPRPFTADPGLANGTLEKSFSYPSGHSTESMVLALVLAEAIPDRHGAILAHARLMGWHRVQIARHYPTDIYAGRVLAQAIVRELSRNEAFEEELAGVKAEIAAVRR